MKEEMSMKDIHKLMKLDMEKKLQADFDRMGTFKIGQKVKIKSIEWFRNNCKWDAEKSVYYLIENPKNNLPSELLLFAGSIGIIKNLDVEKMMTLVVVCSLQFDKTITDYVWDECFFDVLKDN